jgi:hypothetical protein
VRYDLPLSKETDKRTVAEGAHRLFTQLINPPRGLELERIIENSWVILFVDVQSSAGSMLGGLDESVTHGRRPNQLQPV